MQPESNKTFVTFHAKDDLPEIRRDVYKLLMQQEIHFSAIVKNMHAVLSYVRQRNQVDKTYRYHPDELYDHMSRRLFRQLLHRDEACNIFFARRGKSNRTKSLAENIKRIIDERREKQGIMKSANIIVHSAYTNEQPCLQVVDYFLWAVHRLFERKEDRFLRFLWPKVSEIHDLDKMGDNLNGLCYNKENPLTKETLERGLRI